MKARITQNYKRVWKTNKLSGHTWPEDTLLDTFNVEGPCGTIAKNVKPYERAETICNEWNSWSDKFPFEIPRSEREIEKAKKLKLIK